MHSVLKMLVNCVLSARFLGLITTAKISNCAVLSAAAVGHAATNRLTNDYVGHILIVRK